jgi:translation initiation factor IF-3
MNQVRNFLYKGLTVKVAVFFKRWEKNKEDLKKEANEKLEKFAALGSSSKPPRMDGSRLTITIYPKNKT